MINLSEFKSVEEILNHKYWVVDVNTYDYDWEYDSFYAYKTKEEAEECVKIQEEYCKNGKDKYYITKLECSFQTMLELFSLDQIEEVFGVNFEDILTILLPILKIGDK